ncbi:hypothetical protein BJ970_004976 [Saccharopolyspora phatthalungensis]|uniref:Uncharacterized protein n=1 Tax=Saccharopolyspora phatthalungensis TaxID=664693 RepID=A0A840Q4L2_9PSEU|nr:hypothetical protein [Saccharopolyspora phatthalungensis]
MFNWLLGWRVLRGVTMVAAMLTGEGALVSVAPWNAVDFGVVSVAPDGAGHR